MALFNIGTDIALFVFPIPLVWRMSLSLAKKLQLTVLFGIGLVVVAVTITRLPLILDESNDLEIRTVRSRCNIVGLNRNVLRLHRRKRFLLLRASQGPLQRPQQRTESNDRFGRPPLIPSHFSKQRGFEAVEGAAAKNEHGWIPATPHSLQIH